MTGLCHGEVVFSYLFKSKGTCVGAAWVADNNDAASQSVAQTFRLLRENERQYLVRYISTNIIVQIGQHLTYAGYTHAIKWRH